MCNRVIFPFAINSPVLFAPTCDEIIKKFHNLGTRASPNKLDLYVPLYADVAHSPFMNLQTAAPCILAKHGEPDVYLGWRFAKMAIYRGCFNGSQLEIFPVKLSLAFHWSWNVYGYFFWMVIVRCLLYNIVEQKREANGIALKFYNAWKYALKRKILLVAFYNNHNYFTFTNIVNIFSTQLRNNVYSSRKCIEP